MHTIKKNTSEGFDAIPQAILDRLTRFDMPSVRGIAASEQLQSTHLEANGEGAL